MDCYKRILERILFMMLCLVRLCGLVKVGNVFLLKLMCILGVLMK